MGVFKERIEIERKKGREIKRGNNRRFNAMATNDGMIKVGNVSEAKFGGKQRVTMP